MLTDDAQIGFQKQRATAAVHCYTNILGSPNEKRSAPQARDLCIICEAVGVGGSRLILSDDSRFLDTVMNSDTIRQKVSMKNVLGVMYKSEVPELKRKF